MQASSRYSSFIDRYKSDFCDLGSRGDIEFYVRITTGLGDAIMMRPAIIGNIKKYPDKKHVLMARDTYYHIYDDVEQLDVIPISGDTDEELINRTKIYISNYGEGNMYELSSPAIRYENFSYPNIDRSRQEIFCDVVGTDFSKIDYNVKFSDDEMEFAKYFLLGMDRPIGVHLTTSEKYRDYWKVDWLLDVIASKYDGHVVTIGKDYEYVGERSNVVSLSGQSYRKAWAVISKLKFLIGPDSFGVHAAGSTGVPVYGIFGPTDPRCRLVYDQVEYSPEYKKCKRQYCWYRYCDKIACINMRSPNFYWNDAVSKYNGTLIENRKLPKVTKRHSNKTFVRIRGIGDVLMSLPAIATLAKTKMFRSDFIYATSDSPAELLKGCAVIDDIKIVNYNHSGLGLPEVPENVIDDRSGEIHNLINRIDYPPMSCLVPRTDLFGYAMGIDNIDYNSDWKIKPQRSWLDAAKKIFEVHNISSNDKVIALQVGSDGKSRVWPDKLWKRFVNITIRKGYFVIVLSDKAVEGVPDRAIDLTGKTTIGTYAGIIARCSVFVGPDSSGIHIAGCMDIPAIGLFGSVDPKLRISHYSSVVAIQGKADCMPCNDWGKTNCEDSDRCPDCMWEIKPKDVLNRIKRIMANG